MNAEQRNGFKRWSAGFAEVFGSLKLRITLGAVGALVLGIGLATAALVSQAERDTLVAQRHRELAEVVRMSHALAERVMCLERALESTANQLDAATLADDRRLSAFIKSQPMLREMFAHVFVADQHGHLRAYADASGVRRADNDLSDRAYFQRTIAGQHAVVSEVVEGPVSGERTIVFTFPLRSAEGVYGVLGGVLRLADHGVLGDLATAAVAGPAALIVVTDSRGQVLSHPNERFLQKSLSTEPRLSEAFAQWTSQGNAKVSEGSHLQQAGELVSTGGLAGPGWMVWRAMPQAELFAPLHAARRHAVAWASGLIVVVSAAMLWLLSWWLRPLTQLEHRAKHLFDDTQDPQAGWPEASGELGRLEGVLRHVCVERTQLESFNAALLQKLRSVMSAAPVGICFTRHDRFELVSAEFCRLFGWAEHELVGRSPQIIYASSEDYEAKAPEVSGAFAAGEPYVGEREMVRGDGSRFWACARGRPVDVDSASAGTIWTFNDISTEISAREQLEWSATHDVLTGLANRKVLDSRLASMFSAMPRSVPAAVVMIDLDYFKPINDTAGHAAGDAMLKAVAAAIMSCVRVSDLVVRLGGDEFALLLERCAPDVAMRIAENVRAAVADIALSWEQHILRVSASVGMAALAAETRDAAAWIQAADAACYHAKADGRGVVRAAPRALLASRQRRALTEG